MSESWWGDYTRRVRNFFFYYRAKEVRWKKKIKEKNVEELGKNGKVGFFSHQEKGEETIVERK
jgi:hypothetical protein